MKKQIGLMIAALLLVDLLTYHFGLKKTTSTLNLHKGESTEIGMKTPPFNLKSVSTRDA